MIHLHRAKTVIHKEVIIDLSAITVENIVKLRYY